MGSTPPGGGQLDDSIERLQHFVGVLRTALQEMSQREAELETLSGEVQELDQSADQTLAEVVSGLAEQERELEASHDQTEAQLQATAQAAEAVATRVAAVDAAIEKDEEAFTAQLNQDLAALQADYAELGHEGFEALQGVLTTIEGSVDGAQQSLAADFTTLDTAVQEQQARVDTGFHDGVAGLDAEGAALRQHVQEFNTGAEAAAQVWSQELTGTIEQACTRVTGPAEQGCQGFGEAGQAKGDELIKAIDTESQEAMDAVEQDGKLLVEEAQGTEDVLHDDLEGEVQDTLKVAEQGATDISSMSESLFPDLGFAEGVAQQVDELLKAMGGS